MIRKCKCIAVIGDIESGFFFVGPFDSEQEAKAAMLADPTIEEGCTISYHGIYPPDTQETWDARLAEYQLKNLEENNHDD